MIGFRLVSPMSVSFYDDFYDDFDDTDDDGYGLPYIKLSSEEVISYLEEIDEALQHFNDGIAENSDKGLADFFWADDNLDVVTGIYPRAEVHNGKAVCVTHIRAERELDENELVRLKEFISGQYSDGFGEGFEQHEIDVYDGHLYVRLWDYPSWSIEVMND